MKNKLKRLLSGILALAMVISLIQPMSFRAYATGVYSAKSAPTADRDAGLVCTEVSFNPALEGDCSFQFFMSEDSECAWTCTTHLPEMPGALAILHIPHTAGTACDYCTFGAAPSTVAVTSVNLDKSTATMTVGGSALTLTATVLPDNATNKNVSWESDNTAVATVADGVVTAVAEGTANITVTTADGNKTATCAVTVEAAEPTTDPNYLTFTAEEDDSSVTFKWLSGTNVKYSKDNGTTWDDYTDGTKVELNKGETVSFKGKNVKSDYQHYFEMTGKIAASGSVTSLIDENGGDPDIQLVYGSCSYMFKDCAALTKAPELPSTKLENSCYRYMFSGCTSLTEAPALPATQTAESCYAYMFNGCTGLTLAPNLNATELAQRCYSGMFTGCTGLDIVKDKDATHTLEWTIPEATEGSYWYSDMFEDCPNVNLCGHGSKEPAANTTYYQKAAKTPVNGALNITAPKANQTAQTTLKAADLASAKINWSPKLTGGKFDYDTAYTATVTLSPKDAELYTTEGVTFTVKGAKSVKFNKGVLTVTFAKTAAPNVVMRAKAASAAKNSVKLAWNKYPTADSYVIYAAKCNGKGKTYTVKKVATVKASAASYTVKKLSKGTYYKGNTAQ